MQDRDLIDSSMDGHAVRVCTPQQRLIQAEHCTLIEIYFGFGWDTDIEWIELQACIKASCRTWSSISFGPCPPPLTNSQRPLPLYSALRLNPTSPPLPTHPHV